MIWAFLCGWFYGSLLYRARREKGRAMDEAFKAVRDYDDNRQGGAFLDFYAITHTGYEDG